MHLNNNKSHDVKHIETHFFKNTLESVSNLVSNSVSGCAATVKDTYAPEDSMHGIPLLRCSLCRSAGMEVNSESQRAFPKTPVSLLA